MSAADTIITEVRDFLASVDALLETRAVQELVRLSERVESRALVHGVVAGLASVLHQIQERLTSIRTTVANELQHAPALDGLISVLQPLVAGMQCVAAISSEQLEAARLGPALRMSETVDRGLAVTNKVLAAGTSMLDFLPSPEQLDELSVTLDELIETVDEYVSATA